MTFWRTLSAATMGAAVWLTAEYQSIQSAVGLFAVMVMLALVAIWGALEDIARALDYNFDRLRYLHRTDEEE